METESIAYLAVIISIVAALTGVFTAVIAVKSHRRVENIKVLDLRLEVQRARNGAHVAFVTLFDKAAFNVSMQHSVFW
jgi:hypothetical protein